MYTYSVIDANVAGCVSQFSVSHLIANIPLRILSAQRSIIIQSTIK